MATLATYDDLLKSQIQDLYSAEKQFVEGLPKLAKASTSPKLREAFEEHEKVTRGHITRLEKMADALGFKPSGKTCAAAKGLVAEGQEVIDATGDPDVIDAALIAAAQRMEHYEIAAYGTLSALVKQVGNKDAMKLSDETLAEEHQANKLLSKIAEHSVNEEAAN